MEGSFFLLPQDDVTTDIDIRCHAAVEWNLFVTTLLTFGTLLRRSRRNLLSRNVGWWCSKGAST